MGKVVQTIIFIGTIIILIVFFWWFIIGLFSIDSKATYINCPEKLELIDSGFIQDNDSMEEYILRDPETNILYCVFYRHGGVAVEILRNTDGTPKLWGQE